MDNAAASRAVNEEPPVSAKALPGAEAQRGWPLASFLVLLGLAIAIPALLFSGYLLYRFAETERASAAQATVDAARSIRDAVDREIDAMTTTLRVLATSSLLEDGEFASFHARASDALKGTSTFVILADETGQQVLNTRVPYGADLGVVGDKASVTGPLADDSVYVSDVFVGTLAKQPVFNVAVPVVTRNGKRFVLIMTRNAASLEAIIRDQKLPNGWMSALLDGNGKVVAGTPGEGVGDVGWPARVGSGNVAPTTVRVDGKEIVVAIRESFSTGWRVAAFVPATVLEAPLMRSLSLLLLAAVALLALTFLLAIWAARRVARPILRLTDSARALGHGEPVDVLNSSIREANELSRALATAAVERKDSEDQIRFLMRELSHRAKNQLAVVVAMARRTGGDSEILRDFRSVFSERLLALARSTDLLVEQNWKGVPITELVKAQLLPFETGGATRVKMDGPRIDLSADAAQNLGLALHELATNASKYGALSTPGGSVWIRWWLTYPGPEFHITWTEDGGPPVSPPLEPGFGSLMIQRTVAQSLNGNVTHEFPPGGVVWTMTVPLAAIAPAKT